MATKRCKKCKVYFEGTVRQPLCPACKKEEEAKNREESYAQKQQKAAKEEERHLLRKELELLRGFRLLNPALKTQCVEYYERLLRWEGTK